MNRLIALLLASSALVLAACVTINVYFPAAAAQAAADRVIDEVWGGQAAPAPMAPAPEAAPTSSLELPTVRELALRTLDFVMPVARADEPNLDVSSPEIQRLTDSMESRFADLSPYYASGAVGMVADVKTKVLQVPRVTEADVELTFDPPWTRDMMSEAAQLAVGFI